MYVTFGTSRHPFLSLAGLGQDGYDYGSYGGPPLRGNPAATILDSFRHAVWWARNVAGLPITAPVVEKAEQLGIVNAMSPNLQAFYSSNENLGAADQFARALTTWMTRLGARNFRCGYGAGPFTAQFCYWGESGGPGDGHELTISPGFRDNVIRWSLGPQAPGGPLPLPAELGISIPGVPTYTTENPFPQAVAPPTVRGSSSPTVRFENLSGGSAATLRVGDNWRITISGVPANAEIQVLGGKGADNVLSPMGRADGAGVFMKTGSMAIEHVGDWHETWKANGQIVGSEIRFAVIPREQGGGAPAPGPQEIIRSTVTAGAVPGGSWIPGVENSVVIILGAIVAGVPLLAALLGGRR